jgi:hypothetical protein
MIPVDQKENDMIDKYTGREIVSPIDSSLSGGSAAGQRNFNN